jgi:crotonobetainyl-CoA:carnitine CoA-transferase CaiB-like acyl-CoA transferase
MVAETLPGATPNSACARGPLTGVRVIDITTIFMGPSATQMLGDLGADVIKVESPQGDVIRGIGPQGKVRMGPLFLAMNRNKRSIALDLKSPDGRAALLDLVRDADVLAYNVRPQAMARLGLDYATVAAVNPRLIYAGMFGFSQRGRYAASAAFDDLIQAACALPQAMAMSSGDIPRYLPITIADRSVGLYAFGVIAAALYGRERSGRGQQVDIPMFETMVPQVLGDHLYGQTFIPAQGDFGYPRLLSPQRRPYATRDGHVCCLIYTDLQWRAFLKAVGQGDLFDTDPRFANITERTRNIDALYAMVSAEIGRRSTAEMQALLQGTDIPVFPMHTFDSLLTDAHLDDIGFFRTMDHPDLGPIRQMAVPSEWSDTPPGDATPPPRLGQHSREVLREAGYDDARIEALVQSGVVHE